MTVVVARSGAVIVCDNCGHTLYRPRRVTDLDATSAVDVLECSTAEGWTADAERPDAAACPRCSTAARTVPLVAHDAPSEPSPCRSGIYLVPSPHSTNERAPEALDDAPPASMTSHVRELLNIDDLTDPRHT